MKAGAAPERIAVRGRNGKKKAQPKRRVYRPRTPSLEITPDPIAPVAFGEGIITTRSKKLPWPMIGGAILVVLLLVLLMTR